MPAGRFVKRSERKQKKLKLAKEVKAGDAGRHSGTFLFCRHLGTFLFDWSFKNVPNDYPE